MSMRSGVTKPSNRTLKILMDWYISTNKKYQSNLATCLCLLLKLRSSRQGTWIVLESLGSSITMTSTRESSPLVRRLTYSCVTHLLSLALPSDFISQYSTSNLAWLPYGKLTTLSLIEDRKYWWRRGKLYWRWVISNLMQFDSTLELP